MKKICTICRREKEFAEFRKDSSHTDGRRSECKVCSRKKASAIHALKYQETYKVIYQRRSARAKEIIASYKNKGCLVCPETEHGCLGFHHLDSSQKDFGIANARNYTTQQIIIEIEKCVVLCLNCHAKVHLGLIDLSKYIKI